MTKNNVWQISSVMTAMFALVLFFAGAARANLVVGGSFEDPVIPLGSPYLLDISPTGWSGTGDITVQGYAGAVTSGDGNQWLDLNPGTDMGSGISQTIFFNAGMTYEFSFLYNGGGGGSTKEISYLLVSGSGTLLSGVVSTAGMNVYGGTLWNTFSTPFVPTNSGLETLSIVPNGSWSGGFIDAVTISVIPEPATLSLLALGTMFAGRRRS